MPRKRRRKSTKVGSIHETKQKKVVEEMGSDTEEDEYYYLNIEDRSSDTEEDEYFYLKKTTLTNANDTKQNQHLPSTARRIEDGGSDTEEDEYFYLKNKSRVVRKYKKRVRRKKVGSIMHPVMGADGCSWSWPLLELKNTRDKGLAVYAKEKIPAGTMIPILGHVLTKSESHAIVNRRGLSHGYMYRYMPITIDGHPRLNPRHNIGNFGLSVAMMLNEPTRKKPTCKFKMDHVVIGRSLKKGEELTIWYGNSYEVIRKAHGYSLKSNPHLRKPYPALTDRSFPTAAIRRANINTLHKAILACEKKSSQKYIV